MGAVTEPTQEPDDSPGRHEAVASKLPPKACVCTPGKTDLLMMEAHETKEIEALITDPFRTTLVFILNAKEIRWTSVRDSSSSVLFDVTVDQSRKRIGTLADEETSILDTTDLVKP